MHGVRGALPQFPSAQAFCGEQVGSVSQGFTRPSAVTHLSFQHSLPREIQVAEKEAPETTQFAVLRVHAEST